MNNERNQAIDIAKGLGIFFIVWGHEVCPFLYQLLLFHVPLFIVISGILYKPGLSFNKYFINKTHSLFLPYIKYLIVGLLIWLCYHHKKISIEDLEYICNINFPRINGPIWFLLSLFWINILYFFVNLIHSLKKRTIIIISIAICSMIMIKLNINFLFITQALLMTLFYHIGYTYKFQINKMNNLFIFFITLIFLLGVFLTYTNRYRCETVNLNIGNNVFFYYIFGLSGSLLTINFSKYISKYKYSNIISYIGKNSLIILGLHFIFVIPINTFYKEIICELHLPELICDAIKIIYSVFTPIATIFIILLLNIIFLKCKNKILVSKN